MITNDHRIVLNPSAIVRVLGVAAFLLVLASIGGQLARYLTGSDTLYGLVRLVTVDNEYSLPTYFSASLLLFASLLLAIISILKKNSRAPYALQWAILSFGFLYLAFDEATAIHEMLIRPMKELLGGYARGIFHFAWVIPGIAIILIFALMFLKFFFHLPSRTKLLVLVAATLFIGGAVGVELIGGSYRSLYGKSFSLLYSMITTLEESLEMVGVIVFLYALLTYIEDNYQEVQFRFGGLRETYDQPSLAGLVDSNATTSRHAL